jgi:hypothetical protein
VIEKEKIDEQQNKITSTGVTEIAVLSQNHTVIKFALSCNEMIQFTKFCLYRQQ